MKKLLVLFFILLAGFDLLKADTTWTNGGADSSWSNSANWSNGVPALYSSNAVIGTQPSHDSIGLDTGIQTNVIGSLSCAPTLTGSVSILAAGVEQLTVAHNLTNSNNYPVTFSLPVIHLPESADTFTTGGGMEFAGGLNLSTATITVSGTGSLKLGNGSYTTIGINSGFSGAFSGTSTVNYNGTNLQFQIIPSSITPSTSYQLFQTTSGTLASVTLVGNYFSGSLTESPSGFWSGYVGGSWWSFDQSSGIFQTGNSALLSITTGAQLSSAFNGTAYSQALSSVNGSSPYSWSITSGSLPSGLSLNSSTGLISGTATASGTYGFTVSVSDANSQVAYKTFKLFVTDPLVINTSSPLPTGSLSVAYSQSFAASGGTPSYSWSLYSGSLPSGVTLNSAGLLSGTPTASGTFSFVVRVTDSANTVINKSVSLVILAPLSITTTSPISSGINGSYYSSSLSANGGSSPYAWSLTGGGLPTGLSLNGAGLISGTPAASGTFTFTAQVMDALSSTVSNAFSLVIVDPLGIATASPLLTGTKGQAYSQNLSATGGTPSYTWSISSGALPAGITLSAAGLLSGTPTATGTFNITARVADSASLTDSKALSFMVLAPLVISTPTPITTGSVSYPYTQTLTATGGIPPYSWNVSAGVLPGGISMGTDGSISGIPSTSGTFQFTAQVTDSVSGTKTKDYTFAVQAPLVINGALGTFVGLIDRDQTVNNGIGGRIDLSTSKTGVYSGKITQGAKALSFKGKLNTTGSGSPVSVIIASGTSPVYDLELSFDGTENSFTGTLARSGTSAAVNGWRRVWDKKLNPVLLRLGYYSFGLDLEAAQVGDPSIPQGNGYGQFSVASDGGLKVVGKTADGNSISSSGFLGPNGEIPVFQLLYSNTGSLLGKLVLTTGSIPIENSVSGTLTWMKPADHSRAYNSGFGPISLQAYGKYLAFLSSGRTVLGLPDSSGTAQLLFSEGGLSSASIDPNVTAVTFTLDHKVILPSAGTPQNPAGATLKINTANGAVSGQFTLLDGSLKRKVSYQGMIVRPPSGNTKAVGYFLLPQIPVGAETNSTSPILSGQVVIEQ